MSSAIECEGAICHVSNRGDGQEVIFRDDGDQEPFLRPRKGGPGKVKMARRLRSKTTMTLAWVAKRLQMGVWPRMSNLLRAADSGTKGK